MRTLLAGTLALAGLAVAQNAPPPAPVQNQITPQVLGEMLKSATTFSDLIRQLNLKNSLGPDVHTIGPNGQSQHSIDRTAATIGAGAGVGATIGAMTKGQNAALIGALAGAAGGLIIDQIVKNHEQSHPAPVLYPPAQPEAAPVPEARQFKTR